MHGTGLAIEQENSATQLTPFISKNRIAMHHGREVGQAHQRDDAKNFRDSTTPPHPLPSIMPRSCQSSMCNVISFCAGRWCNMHKDTPRCFGNSGKLSADHAGERFQFQKPTSGYLNGQYNSQSIFSVNPDVSAFTFMSSAHGLLSSS
jgi:hypothetical protein